MAERLYRTRAFEVWRGVDMTTVGYILFHDVELWIISEKFGCPFLITSIFSVSGMVFLDNVLDFVPVRNVAFQLFVGYTEASGVRQGYSIHLRSGELHCESLEYGS